MYKVVGEVAPAEEWKVGVSAERDLESIVRAGWVEQCEIKRKTEKSEFEQ